LRQKLLIRSHFS